MSRNDWRNLPFQPEIACSSKFEVRSCLSPVLMILVYPWVNNTSIPAGYLPCGI